jgi:hypothetical protein
VLADTGLAERPKFLPILASGPFWHTPGRAAFVTLFFDRVNELVHDYHVM